MAKTVVVGSINMDVVATAARHPKPGETVLGQQLHLLPGGKGANQAVASSRANAETLMVGRLGCDVFADDLENFLANEGVDLSFVERAEGVATGTALIAVAGGENTIVVVPGANFELSSDDVRGVPVTPGDVVIAQLEVRQSTIVGAFRLARAAGATTVLNAAPASQCDPELLRLSDLLVVNETELCELLGGTESPEDMTPARALSGAAKLRVFSEQIVIVTLGAQGAVALDRGNEIFVPGVPVQVVDTTGAGDCFVGNLAAQLSRRVPLQEAVTAANLAASLCVQTLGAAVSMPRASEYVLDASLA